MFSFLIKELELEGYEIVITSRPLSNTIELLNQNKIKHTIIGKHYGKNIFRKVVGFPIRVIQLYRYLKKQKPDLGVSQSSFHSPVVSTLLSIPSIYTNDNEHAWGNKISVFFATKVLLPEFVSKSKIKIKGINNSKIFHYPGVKEGIYLWNIYHEIYAKRKLMDDNNFLICYRPEPQSAQYYHAKINFMDDILTELMDADKWDIVIFPRDEHQLRYYQHQKFNKIRVSEKPLSFIEIASTCNLFIGAGGSMTRELAILGIPTISVYQDKLLDVDRYLIQQRLMWHEPSLTIQKTIQYIHYIEECQPSYDLIQKGKEAYSLFKDEILKFNAA